jgi:hypothetical protein
MVAELMQIAGQLIDEKSSNCDFSSLQSAPRNSLNLPGPVLIHFRPEISPKSGMVDATGGHYAMQKHPSGSCSIVSRKQAAGSAALAALPASHCSRYSAHDAARASV